MYQGKKILALIPARGGSKGIKDKNIVMLCGKPLIAHTIQAARDSVYIDSVVVTTDSERIAGVAREYGAEVPFIRPAELARDESKTIDAVLHAVQELKEFKRIYDTLLLLQPTSPLRTVADIDQAIECFYHHGEQSLASVSPVEDHPLLIRSIENGVLKPLFSNGSTCRRQDMKPYYRVNGCIYINKIDSVNEETSFNDNLIPFIMKSTHSVDIDEMTDVVIASCYMNVK